jgi:hypothetical protein
MDSSSSEGSWAERDAILFLDVQVGKSTLQAAAARAFLSRPDVHLGIDPEFSMKNGGIPGKRIGTYDAEDINYASRFLQDLVTRYKIPPKVLVVHRFTRKGVTNTPKIKLDPRVQVVMHMDGFGPPRLKRATFRSWIKAEPVQFVGWKQFYKPRNDSPPTSKPVAALVAGTAASGTNSAERRAPDRLTRPRRSHGWTAVWACRSDSAADQPAPGRAPLGDGRSSS